MIRKASLTAVAVAVLLGLLACPIWAAEAAQPDQDIEVKTGGSLYPAYCGYTGQINSWARDIFDTYYYVNVPAGTGRLSAGVTSNDIGWRVTMHYGSRGTAYGIQSSAYVDNPTPGYWYIRVYASYGNRSGTFWITCSSGGGGGAGWTGGACSNVGDAGSGMSSAMGVTYGRCYNASIGFRGDNDYYRFWFSGGVLNVYSLGSIDTYAYLYASNGSLLTYNDDSGQSLNFHINRSSSSGYYYLRVRHYSSSGTGSYTLYLGGTGSGGSSGTGGSTGTGSCASATSINHNTNFYGSIGTAGQQNYYRIYVPRSGTLRVYTTYAGSNLDTYGYLYNSNCTYLTSNDDSGTGYNFDFSRSITAGYYYIMVRAYSSSATGSYHLYVSFQ